MARKNNKKLGRRDFLRLAGSFVAGQYFVEKLSPKIYRGIRADSKLPNVIIILFDTLSARHLSLYGYPRATTPALERFAEKAAVFHNHYSAANFTSPSTASLLTGTYPWTHRAFHQAGTIPSALTDKNLFRYLGDSVWRVAFAQNVWGDLLLRQFHNDLDRHLPVTSFSLLDQLISNKPAFDGDSVISFRAFEDFLFQNNGIPASAFAGFMEKVASQSNYALALQKHKDEYPLGIPNLIKYKLFFLLEDVFEGVRSEIDKLQRPSVAYFHFYSPHEPYFPRREFVDLFNDDWMPVSKQIHPLSDSVPEEQLMQYRRAYDRYIAHVDHEFGLLFDYLKSTGVLENSIVIVTSDHGQLFERGTHGHVTPLLYEPLIKIPLIVSTPGQNSRRDIFAPTSIIDILPTLLNLLEKPTPELMDGELLPGFGGVEKKDRSIFAMDAKENSLFAPIKKATFALIKGGYKLIYYMGYLGYGQVFELYDLSSDPDELEDLSSSMPDVLETLKRELLNKLRDINTPYS